MKNIIKSILFLAILLALVEGITYFLLPNSNVKKYGLYKTAAYDILEEEENTIDVIALGDSLIYTSINPMQIWDNHGFTVYDCAIPAQIIQDCYKYLKVAIDSQNPKVVLMEANVLFRDYRKYKWYNRIIVRAENLVPLNKFHNNWKKFTSNDPSTWVDSSKGYKKVTKIEGSTNYEYMIPTDEVRKLPEGNLEYFEKIVDLCNENDIKLILISTPSQVSYNYPRKNATIKIAQKYNLDYLDLNEGNPAGINWIRETKDEGGHVNYLGAIKVSEYIGNYLKDLSILEDHRGDKKYALWNDAYQKYIAS